ncbi:MAG: hypothetical protein JXQ79_03305 [Rhodobacteraceae bacterium]|nr:hypothetical protein [Paracoccaceae bacterium]
MREPPPPLPEHLCPVPPAPPARSWLWQVPLGVVLTLGVLYLLSGFVNHCTKGSTFCPRPEPIDESAQKAPVATLSPADALPKRPVMAYALASLPLSMGDAPGAASYVLPPGQTLAEAATQTAAITLDEMNLIAVVESDGVRHALVRLANGRILRVREGDRLEDATVAAIGARTLYMLRPDNTPRALVLRG